MFDKKLYAETCSALHASEDTLAEVLKITAQQTQKTTYPRRPAIVFSLILVLLISSAALAAGSQIRYGGWPRHASLQDAEKMGFRYPEQLGEYRLLEKSPSRIHTAPAKSNKFTAWLKPDYVWMSLDYENEKKQSLSVSFGKMEDPLWMYCFSYDENTGIWTGADNPETCTYVSTDSRSHIKNVTEYEYEGCTIYLADRVTEYFDGNSAVIDNRQQIEAHWTDAEIGLCFSILSSKDFSPADDTPSVPDKQNMTQKEMMKYVRSIIDHNR